MSSAHSLCVGAIGIGFAELLLIAAVLGLTVLGLAGVVALVFLVVRALQSRPHAPPSPPSSQEARAIRCQVEGAEKVRLLAIFHFVFAGIGVLGVFFLLAHYTIMNGLFANPEMWSNAKAAPPPAGFFKAFIWFYLFMGLLFAAGALLNLLSGLFLLQKRHRTYSIVVAALNCFHFPFGTALGIFTLTVLTRHSVRVIYSR